MSTLLQRLRGGRDESGFTLVELLVAMLLTSVVMVMLGTFYVNIARSTASARASREAVGQTALAVNAVRGAVTMAADNPVSLTVTTPAVNSGGPTSLAVTSYSNSAASIITPSLVTFTVDSNGYLTEYRQVGVIAATGYWVFTGITTSRRVAGPFVLGSGTPFFSYVDSNGAVLTSGATALTTADLSRVAFVRVTAKVANTALSGATDPVVATTSIGLTNVSRTIAATTPLPALVGGR